MRGGDSENNIEIASKRGRGITKIPGETDKAMSFIEDIVYVAAYCNAMLTSLPIHSWLSIGKHEVCWGICLVDQTCQWSHKPREWTVGYGREKSETD